MKRGKSPRYQIPTVDLGCNHVGYFDSDKKKRRIAQKFDISILVRDGSGYPELAQEMG